MTKPFDLKSGQFSAHVTITYDMPPDEEADVIVSMPVFFGWFKIRVKFDIRQVIDLKFLCEKVLQAVQGEP